MAEPPDGARERKSPGDPATRSLHVRRAELLASLLKRCASQGFLDEPGRIRTSGYRMMITRPRASTTPALVLLADTQR
jgi:hypothetical protein